MWYSEGMPRGARVVLPGVPYHITHRGNNRQAVFFAEEDRHAYLAFLRKCARAQRLKVLAYCLMPNHVHLVAIPEREGSLAKGVGYTHLRYAQAFNWRHERSGHVWENRYYSCALDERHLVAALAYVERNPVRAGLVVAAPEYEWSSAGAHVGQHDGSGLLDIAAWRSDWTVEGWLEMLSAAQDEAQVEALRQGTRAGRPVGSEAFLTGLEHRLGRRLRPLSRGRPPGR